MKKLILCILMLLLVNSCAMFGACDRVKTIIMLGAENKKICVDDPY